MDGAVGFQGMTQRVIPTLNRPRKSSIFVILKEVCVVKNLLFPWHLRTADRSLRSG